MLGVLAGACVTLSAAVSTAGPTDSSTQPVPPARPSFKTFRFDENYSGFKVPPAGAEPFDEIKRIPLDASDPAAYLSVGGESRTRYDYFSHPGFDLRGLDHDDFVLQRFLLHTDWHLDSHLRVFTQIVSAFQFDPESVPSPQQDDALDLQQAFVDYRFGETREESLTLRGGRMEMGFGSSRLVSPREPTNVRLNFDGVRATLVTHGVTVDAFLTRPVEQARGIFNDGQNDAQTFWGLYSTFAIAPAGKASTDLYYLGLRREKARFDAGVATDERHSVGSRLWGQANGFDYDFEGVFQFGTFGEREIRAWTVASNVGYTWEGLAWKPRVGLKANVASGSTSDTGSLGTFYALFPRQSYFSEINLLAPSNFFDLHPSLQIKPVESLTIVASWDPFWKYTAADAVYGPGRVAIPSSASAGTYVGSTIDLQAEWMLTRQLSVTGYYAHFFPGEVVHSAGGRDTDYCGAWVTFKF